MTTTKPQSTTESLPQCPFCKVTPVRRDHVYRYGSIAEHPEDSYCPIKNCTIGINDWTTCLAPASAAPIVDVKQQIADLLNEDRCMFCGGKTAHEPDCDHGRPAAAAPQQPDAETFVKQWLATLQDESHVTDEDAEDLVFRIIAYKNTTAAPVGQSEHVATTATEQPDPTTCPGCAAGRCMVHERIIRADATSTARAAAEEIDKLLASRLRPDIYINFAPANQEIAAIIERHCSRIKE